MRNYEAELIEIEKEHLAKNARIEINTEKMIEACKEPILFYVQKGLILGRPESFGVCLKMALMDLVGDKINDGFEYNYNSTLCINGCYLRSRFVVSTVLSEMEVNPKTLSEKLEDYIESIGYEVDWACESVVIKSDEISKDDIPDTFSIDNIKKKDNVKSNTDAAWFAIAVIVLCLALWFFN